MGEEPLAPFSRAIVSDALLEKSRCIFMGF